MKHLASVLIFSLAILASGLLLCNTALAQDEVGIYWDAGFTEVVGTPPAIPGPISGYVVLHNPTGTGGVMGWEATIEAVGPGFFMTWDFQGVSVNAGTGTSFAIGYVTPLPQATDIVLASFEMLVTDTAPVLISMTPSALPAVAGQMSYFSGDNNIDMIAMSTTTGKDEVAGVNGGNPWISLDKADINFGPVAVGETTSRYVVLTNDSDEPLPVDISLDSAGSDMTLPSASGAMVVPAKSSLTVMVAFAPTTPQEFTGAIVLGPNLPNIPLLAVGMVPTVSWSLFGDGNCGTVAFGESAQEFMTLSNTGDAAFTVDLAYRQPNPDFDLLYTIGAVVLEPGDSVPIRVKFTPSIEGYQANWLSTGNAEIPDILVDGTGGAPTVSWDAPTLLDFGNLLVNTVLVEVITVVNTGDTVIPLQVSLTEAGTAFAIAAGAGTVELLPGRNHKIYVQYTPLLPQLDLNTLTLGDVVPPITLQGTALPDPASITVAPAVIDFPTTLVGLFVEQTLVLNNTGPYAIPIDVHVVTAGGFSIVSGGGIQDMASGASLSVMVRFTPLNTFVHHGTLGLGVDGLVSVPLSGLGTAGSLNCGINPSDLDFGNIVTGQIGEMSVTVTNDGANNLFLDPVIADPAFLVDGTPQVLAPGQAHVFQIQFAPPSIGYYAGFLSFGDGACGGLNLAGKGLYDAADYDVSPATVDLGVVAVDSVIPTEVVVTNSNSDAMELDVGVSTITTGFSVVQGGGRSLLLPGQVHRIVVLAIVQPYARQASLVLGAGLPDVPLSVTGFVEPDCHNLSVGIRYSSVYLGASRTIHVSIINRGSESMILIPASDSPVFVVDETPIEVAAATTVAIPITFTPTEVAIYTGEVDFGNDLCSTVSCVGDGVTTESMTENLLGIYFDEGYLFNDLYNIPVGQSTTGYLVLSNPTEATGLIGWRCRFSTNGPVVVTEWSLAGDATNSGITPLFDVNLGTPLPYVEQNLLATFQFEPAYLSSITFLLYPISVPEAPYYMTATYGGRPDSPYVARTLFGGTVVAFVNTTSVGVVAQTPEAQVLGQQVQLSWAAAAVEGDGYHVYRRLEDEATVRLTAEPLSSASGTLTYTDAPVGLAAGTAVFYSYTIVRDGVEIAQSPEVEITVPVLPDTVTRLMPNVPNPFNPRTSIHFELGRAQRVDLKIYDVTGRLVRELVNASLAAGPHTRIWQGRDNQGRQVSSGAYYVRMVTPDKISSQKIMLLK